jgi:ribonuclease HII
LRWVGIDEAGYGPNLGPMVMTAVIAESKADGCRDSSRGRRLDFWGDLLATVDRAGGDPDRLWVDDSKAILRGGKGRDRLEMTCLAAVHAAGNELPGSLGELITVLGAGALDDTEVLPWIESGHAENGGLRLVPRPALVPMLARGPLRPQSGSWEIAAVRSVVVGPARFNAGLAAHGLKSDVHYQAFERLLRAVWERSADLLPTFVLGDKHGGRHYYFQRLSQSFPEAWIDRGLEGPDLSRYTLRQNGQRLELSLVPRADRNDGLVAMASIISKTVRELWMDVFNRYWGARVPGLRPTAGYPLDSMRFRREIEAAAAAEQCDPARWWRIK